MEYESTEDLSTIGKGGKCKYGKRKYRIAWVENASTETGRAILTQKWQKNITACQSTDDKQKLHCVSRESNTVMEGIIHNKAARSIVLTVI